MPTAADLYARFQLSSGEGGMQAEIVDWPQMIDDYVYHPDHGLEAQQFTSPWTQEGLEWARQKLKLIGQYLRRAAKRRTSPP
eukprot:8742259-Pyramimonas_sp.AAC.1